MAELSENRDKVSKSNFLSKLHGDFVSNLEINTNENHIDTHKFRQVLSHKQMLDDDLKSSPLIKHTIVDMDIDIPKLDLERLRHK